MPGHDPARFTTSLLHHAADPFRLLVESVKDYAIYMLDPEGRIASWNSGAERIKGYAAEEVLGRPFATMFAAADVDAGKPGAILAAALADGRYEEEELRPRRDGSTFWAIFTVTALHEGGRHVGYAVVVRDITERKQAADALRASEERFRLFMDNTPAQVWVTDEDGVSRFANAALARELGYRPAEIIGRPVADVMAGYPIDEYLATDRRVLATGEPIQLVVSAPREIGDAGRFLIYKFPLATTYEGRRLVGGVAIDVTDRERSVEALRASEERFRLIVDGIRDYSLYMLDPAGHVVSWNEGAVRLFGYAADEIIGQHRRRFFTPEDVAAGMPQREQERATATGLYAEEGWRVRKDGSRFWAEGTLTALRDAAGGLRGFVKITHDLTERRQAEERLRVSEARFRTLVTAMSQVVWTTDPTGEQVRTTPPWSEYTGLPAEEVRGPGWANALHPDDRERAAAAWRRAVATGERYDVQYRVRRADGQWRLFTARAVPLRDPDGAVLEWVGVCMDDTDRHAVEHELLVSQQRLRVMLENSSDIISIHDPAGVMVYQSPSIRPVLGYEPDELLGQGVMAYIHPDETANTVAKIAGVKAGPGVHPPFLTRFRHKDGSWRWFECVGTNLLDNPLARGVLFNARDVTARVQAEDGLRVSEGRFRTLVTALAQIVWVCDPNGENAVSTPSWAEFTGLSEDEARGWGWVKAVHPEDRDRAAELWQRSLATRQPFDAEYRVRRADGQWRHVSVRGVPLFNDDGAVREWVGVCMDDTERFRAEEGMRLRDRAIAAVSQGILITDPNRPDNPIIYASRGFEVVTGYPPEEAVGRNCRFLQGKDTDPDMLDQLRAALAAGREWQGELLNYRKDGTPFWNALYVTPVRDAAGWLTHFVGVQADVTERRRLERAFQQAQKMEAVGRLAGGVAHDFNNLLTVISGFSDMILMGMPPSDPNREAVIQIRQAGERAAGLTRQLLAFSRRQVVQPVVLDLNDVVADAEKMLRRLIGEDIRLTTVLDPHLPRVKADPGQVDQVLMNLVVNARDAMPTGGKLTIETRAVELEDGQTRYPDLKPGRFAQLSVTDTGHGMTSDVKAHVFEPFFTTKGPGKGTGLGLATVHGIVKQAGGHISVHSEVGVGTTFKVFLPAADALAPRASDSRIVGPLRGTETVLVVEDEEAVRRIARLSLETQGYTVLEAGSGPDSLELLDRLPDPVHLLVTDVVMPDMGGRQLAEAVRSRHPGIRVLFVSGYTDDAVIRHGVIEATEAFLQKPFTPLTLAKKVREVLDGGPGG